MWNISCFFRKMIKLLINYNFEDQICIRHLRTLECTGLDEASQTRGLSYPSAEQLLKSRNYNPGFEKSKYLEQRFILETYNILEPSSAFPGTLSARERGGSFAKH